MFLKYTTIMDNISGELIIFHAGSLSVPLKEISIEFNKIHPEVKILGEAAGSVDSARKITDLNRPCDIMASADYSVIDKIFIPRYADWNIKFAANEMAIVYTAKGRYADKINEKNWYETLMNPDVSFGRADPDSDPCGYRTLMTFQLAERYYKKPELFKNLIGKNQEFILPKEIDLLGLLDSGSLDYIFVYRSLAIQHGLKCLILPDQINLKHAYYGNLYSSAKVEINGSHPGEKQMMSGEPIIYGLTILRDAPNRAAAEAYVAFLLSENQGIKILEKDGQPSVIPMPVENYDKLPASLRPYVERK
jgi:molybdate/tungstate transport system substrate-binding protein